MIYCVVPEALADELYDKLAGYYSDDPNVKVIIDRRKSERRDREERREERRPGDIVSAESDSTPRREIRDRRRARAAGDFPRIDP